MANIKNKYLKEIVSFIMLTIGSIISAFALQSFLIPNTILDGGVNGISIILSKFVNVPLAVLILFLNAPFFFLGYKQIGRNFLVRTVYSMAIFTIGISFFSLFEPITEEMLLATVFGGLILGVGEGLIIRSGGCSDGSESLAIVLSKKTPFSVGEVVLIMNLIIYTCAGFAFGFDRAMYSLLTYIITFKTIDFVSEGLEQAKAALIVTDKGSHISEEIYNRLGRTTTTIKGKGLISGQKEVLYCVLTRVEIYELRRIIDELDESAFITILEVSDIIGDHIKSSNTIKKLG